MVGISDAGSASASMIAGRQWRRAARNTTASTTRTTMTMADPGHAVTFAADDRGEKPDARRVQLTMLIHCPGAIAAVRGHDRRMRMAHDSRGQQP